MSDTEQGNFTIVLGPRHIAVGLFMVVALMGTFSALTYVVGRVVAPLPASAQERAPAEQVLVVDASDEAASSRTAPVKAAPAKAAKPAVVPHVAAPVSRPRQTPASRKPYFAEPQPGQLFFQVAAVQRGVAEVCVEYLRRQRFDSQYTDGPDEQSYRVLVGPLRDSDEIRQLRARLGKLGFRPFLRRIKQQEG